jgi:GT2 family glycosyltransferase
MNNPLVSIVVLSYNRKTELAYNLNLLQKLSYDNYEVLIVDNMSTDGSVDIIKSQFSNFGLIEMGYNSGVSRGRNAGFRKANGEYIIYLDDDSYAPSDICEKTIHYFNENKNIGSLSFLIKDKLTGRILNDFSNKIIGHYWGGGHALKKSVLDKINYLDEDFFFGGEEIDSSLRMMKIGYYVRNTPEIIIIHDSQQGVLSTNKKKMRIINYIKTFGMFYWYHFPFRYALVFTLRLFLSHMKNSLIKFKDPLLPFKGIYSLFKVRSVIKRKREVVNKEIVRFYFDPNTQASSLNKPIFHKNII